MKRNGREIETCMARRFAVWIERNWEGIAWNREVRQGLKRTKLGRRTGFSMTFYEDGFLLLAEGWIFA